MEILVSAEKNLLVAVSVLPLIRDHFFVHKKQLTIMFQAMELLMYLKARYELSLILQYLFKQATKFRNATSFWREMHFDLEIGTKAWMRLD